MRPVKAQTRPRPGRIRRRPQTVVVRTLLVDGAMTAILKVMKKRLKKGCATRLN